MIYSSMILALELNISVPFLCKGNYDYKMIFKFLSRISYIKLKYVLLTISILIADRIANDTILSKLETK